MFTTGMGFPLPCSTDVAKQGFASCLRTDFKALCLVDLSKFCTGPPKKSASLKITEAYLSLVYLLHQCLVAFACCLHAFAQHRNLSFSLCINTKSNFQT